MESPSGMIRTGVAARAGGAAATTPTSTSRTASSNLRESVAFTAASPFIDQHGWERSHSIAVLSGRVKRRYITCSDADLAVASGAVPSRQAPPGPLAGAERPAARRPGRDDAGPDSPAGRGRPRRVPADRAGGG